MKLILGFNSNCKCNEILNWSINKHAEVLSYSWEIQTFFCIEVNLLFTVFQFNWKQYVANLRDALLCSTEAQEAVQHLSTHILWHLILVSETEVSTADIWFIFPCINRKHNYQCRTYELGSTHSSVMIYQHL